MLARKIAYNVIANSFLKLVSILISIISIGMLERYLGVFGFGEYTTVLNYFALFTAISDLGLYPEMTKQISRKNDEEEEGIINKIFTLRLFSSFIVFILALFFIILSPYIKSLDYSSNVRLGILIMAISFLFSSSYGLLNGLFQKKLRMDKVIFAELIGKFFQITIIFLAVKYNKGFLFAVSYMLFSMLFNFLIVFLFTKKIISLKLDFDFAYWKSFLKKSLPLGIGAIATFCYFKADSIILGLYHDQSQVGIYGAAYKIIETLVFFPAMVIGLVFPILSKFYQKDHQIFNKTANFTLKFFVILIVPMIISVQFLADKIVVLIGKEEFLKSGDVLRILIFSLAFMFFGQLFTNLLVVSHRQKSLMKILIIGAIFNSISNLLTLEIYDFFQIVKIQPYFPMAVISVSTEMLVAIISLYILIKNNEYKPKLQKISYIFIAGIFMFFTYYFSIKITGNASLFSSSNLVLFTTIFLAVFVYFFTLFIFKVISKNEIKQLISKK